MPRSRKRNQALDKSQYTPVEALEEMISDRGSTPLASTTFRLKSLIYHDGITITLPFGKVMVPIGSGKVMVPDRKWQARRSR